jgi:hypothetical protein
MASTLDAHWHDPSPEHWFSASGASRWPRHIGGQVQHDHLSKLITYAACPEARYAISLPVH